MFESVFLCCCIQTTVIIYQNILFAFTLKNTTKLTQINKASLTLKQREILTVFCLNSNNYRKTIAKTLFFAKNVYKNLFFDFKWFTFVRSNNLRIIISLSLNKIKSFFVAIISQINLFK